MTALSVREYTITQVSVLLKWHHYCEQGLPKCGKLFLAVRVASGQM